MRSPRTASAPVQQISRSICVLRRQRIILDSDLAKIYGVSTSRLNQAAKRNIERFPRDFVFRLSAAEHSGLISQFVTSNAGRGGRRKLPLAFTEYGAIQAANVLNCPRAAMMGVYVVRAFVRLREMLASNKELARRVDELEERLEKKLTTHEAIAGILCAIRQLMNPAAHATTDRLYGRFQAGVVMRAFTGASHSRSAVLSPYSSGANHGDHRHPASARGGVR